MYDKYDNCPYAKAIRAGKIEDFEAVENRVMRALRPKLKRVGFALTAVQMERDSVMLYVQAQHKTFAVPPVAASDENSWLAWVDAQCGHVFDDAVIATLASIIDTPHNGWCASWVSPELFGACITMPL